MSFRLSGQQLKTPDGRKCWAGNAVRLGDGWCWCVVNTGESRRAGARNDQSQDGDAVVAHVRRGADPDLHADAARLVPALPQLADLQAAARQPRPAAAAVAVVHRIAARPAAARRRRPSATTASRASPAATAAAAAAAVGVQLQLKENNLHSYRAVTN